MPRRSSKRANEGPGSKGLAIETRADQEIAAESMADQDIMEACPQVPATNDGDLHVVELGSGLMLDIFINLEGKLTTFLSVDGQLLAELPVVGQA